MRKNILITGGSSGLGKSLTMELSKKNNIIVISKDEINEIEKINVDYYYCDITDYNKLNNTINSIIKKYQKIDVLINCAGLYINGILENNNPQQIIDVINVNLTGTILCCQLIITNMKKHNNGFIININSQLSNTYRAERSVYCASKWGVTGFSNSLQEEIANNGIKVTNLVIGTLNETMKINGIKYRRPIKYIDNLEIVNTIKFLLNTPKDISIPEITVKSIYDYKYK